jgi:hypothetical protein
VTLVEEARYLHALFWLDGKPRKRKGGRGKRAREHFDKGAAKHAAKPSAQ